MIEAQSHINTINEFYMRGDDENSYKQTKYYIPHTIINYSFICVIKALLNINKQLKIIQRIEFL